MLGGLGKKQGMTQKLIWQSGVNIEHKTPTWKSKVGEETRNDTEMNLEWVWQSGVNTEHKAPTWKSKRETERWKMDQNDKRRVCEHSHCPTAPLCPPPHTHIWTTWCIFLISETQIPYHLPFDFLRKAYLISNLCLSVCTWLWVSVGAGRRQ